MRIEVILVILRFLGATAEEAAEEAADESSDLRNNE
jgi:hypothetical protein